MATLAVPLIAIATTNAKITNEKANEKAQCSYTDPTYGVSYNFYALKLQSGGQLSYYSVEDQEINNDDEAAYTYHFNFCSPVLEYPHQACNSTTHDFSYCSADKIHSDSLSCTQDASERPTIDGLAYAYQLRADDGVCFPLSSSVTDGSNIEITLRKDLDPPDPTQGVDIHFKNGAWANDPCGVNREFIVRLKCENDPASIPRLSDVVEEEYERCRYMLTVETIHGCPTACPAYANSLCASQGLCDYDYSSNRSRCFCYYGYEGSACEKFDKFTLYSPIYAISENIKKNTNPKHAKSYVVEIPMTNPISGELENKKVNVSYDLTEAEDPERVYQVKDTKGNTIDYEFFFNLGGTVEVELLPEACHRVLFPCLKDKSYCDMELAKNETDSEFHLTNPGSSGYAFRYLDNSQYEDKEDECIMLGTAVEEMTLYDDIDNAAHGVVIHYVNGSYSQTDSDEAGKVVNCGININLVCPDSRLSFYEPEKGAVYSESDVEDPGKCQFELTYETPFGCPYNCITKVMDKHKRTSSSFAVCGGRGMCVADPAIGFTRCICDEMWYGNDCGKEFIDPNSIISQGKTHSDAGFSVAIAIITILLIGAAVAAAYLYLRNKTLEKYAVPILDEAEQIEPRVPDYSDSDSDHFHNRPKIGGSIGGKLGNQQEMVTVTTNLSGSTKSGFADKKDKIKKMFDKGKKSKKRGKNKYQVQTYSDDDYSDDDDNGPSAYLAANQDDDSDDSDE